MSQLSSRLSRLVPSATLAMSQRSAELREQGIDIINLSVGEPDFFTPAGIKAAAKAAIDDNWSYYSPVAGYVALRQAIVDKLRRENGLAYSPAEILVSNGAKQSVCNTLLALVNAGDEVLIPAPYWVSYPQMALLAGGTPVFIPSTYESHFKITPSQLSAALTPRSRVLILCSPCNPTGSVYTSGELAALAAVVLAHHDLFVISDEIYEHINYVGSHASIAAVDGMRARTIVVNGVSKAYAMTGWRIGYIAAPEWIVKGCNTLQGQYTSGPCSISQKAAVAAYTLDQGPVEAMRQAFARRRELITQLVRAIDGFDVHLPDGAFYVFPRCSSFFGKRGGGRTISSSTDLALYLLDVAHVATVAGDAFGAPDCLRLSYATSEENILTALQRVAASLAQLQ